jgi:drug/metabolite transporter (DMT)-like permease
MIIGTFLLTCHDGISKWMTGNFHVGEVLLYRSIVPVCILAVVLFRAGGTAAFRPRFPAANFTRAVLAAITSFAVVAAYAVMPLADALAIIFASPIIVTALSVPFLGETVGWRRWSAVLVGFLGVVVMINPGSDVFQMGALIALLAAIASATRDVVTRRLGSGDSTTNILFYTTSVTALVGLVMTLVDSSGLPTVVECGWFVAAGLLVTSAHWLLIKALQLAQASVVAPLRYLAIVYGAIIGFLVFDEVPGNMQLIGAAIVVSAGIYIVRRSPR